MTKQPPPLSFHRALSLIIGELGTDECAEIVEMKPRTVYNWADPDTDAQIPIGKALKLDRAYSNRTGKGMPILGTYLRKAECEAEGEGPDMDAVMTAIAETSRETGEAVSAALDMVKDNRSPQLRRDALREVEEAMESIGGLLRILGKEPA